MEPQRYRFSHFNVDYHPGVLTPKQAQVVYDTLENKVPWLKDPNLPLSLPERSALKRRVNRTYGDPGLTYTIKFQNNTVHRTTTPWDEMPILLPIKQYLETITGQQYNICVVQRYPSGKIGINPHRDKEMTPGTTICGISLGETRTLTLQRSSAAPAVGGAEGAEVELPLYSGSLYIMFPPTNDYYTHCIEKDDTTSARISLTFRNYRV